MAEIVVRVEVANPIEHDVDLVAICVVASAAGTGLRGAIAQVDYLLGGALMRLRTQGAHAPRELYLTRHDGAIRAPVVLLLWLGAEENLNVNTLSSAAARAVDRALFIGARSIGFAPGLHDAGVLGLNVETVARSVAGGARSAFALAEPPSDKSLVFALEVSEGNLSAAARGLQ